MSAWLEHTRKSAVTAFLPEAVAAVSIASIIHRIVSGHCAHGVAIRRLTPLYALVAILHVIVAG